MKKTLINIGCIAALLFITIHLASGLNSESVIRLKEAGVSDATIQMMVREKVVETAAFSVQEIIDMKKAGISEKTIRMVIKEGSFLKDTAAIIYGKDIRSIEFTTAGDVIELKRAGISDAVIQAILYVVGESSDSQRKDAYDLLKEMEIRVDLRGGE